MKMVIRFLPLFIILSVSALPAFCIEPVITKTARFQLDKSSRVFYRGEISLASDSMWGASAATSAQGVAEFYVIPPEHSAELFMGRRMLAVENERMLRQGRYLVSQLHWPCREYAEAHDNTGPAAITDLDAKKYPYVLNSIEKSPYPESDVQIEGPFVFLVPNVAFEPARKRDAEFDAPREPGAGTAESQRHILAFELRPYIDDGKHWVLFTDGMCSREPIDAKLVLENGTKIVPIKPADDNKGSTPAELTYLLLATCDASQTNPIPVTLRNSASGSRVQCLWDISSSKVDDASILAQVHEERTKTWLTYVAQGGSPILENWIRQYEKKGEPSRRPAAPIASLYGLFGGESAIQETLQLQNFRDQANGSSNRNIRIADIKGVEVKSHPYDEMLKGQKGGTLAIADLVPSDRFFIYVGKPQSLLGFLDDGSEFLSRLGATMTGNSLDYELKEKYLARLGINEAWLRLFLRPELVRDMALVLPDLYLIDSTDVTVITRPAKPKLVQELFRQAGFAEAGSDPINERDIGNGSKVFWTFRDDLLFVGTSRSELEYVLEAGKGPENNSLGKSAEFRYMLTQLPVKNATRMYAYFSDGFIRRQVGPAVKIGQNRREVARKKLESVQSGLLMAALDGFKPQTLAELQAGGYVPEGLQLDEYSLGSNGVASSRSYGTLAQPFTLAQSSTEMAGADEAEAYKTYVENYSRYWRRYFDPIAIRMDDGPGQTLETTTFILPLIDNSAYNGLREFALSKEDGMDLKVPGMSPEPVLMLSLNLRDESWRSIAEGLSEIFLRYGRISPALLDDLGPGLHLAIHDADPVIALGSGDIMGIFNSGVVSGSRESTMVFVPILMTVLTRPCSLVVETRNPDRTRQYLRQITDVRPTESSAWQGGFNVSFRQVETKDSWICSIDIMGVAKLRYGLEVQGNYLMVRNIPWSNLDRVARTEVSPMNGACLQAYPSACNLQLPGLFAAAQDHELAATMRGLAVVYPMVVSGASALDNAPAEHARLFGFKPVHPGNGKWLWSDGQAVSSDYGSVFRQKQPAYQKSKDDFGAFAGISFLSVSMQFEESGLRTMLRWKPN